MLTLISRLGDLTVMLTGMVEMKGVLGGREGRTSGGKGKWWKSRGDIGRD